MGLDCGAKPSPALVEDTITPLISPTPAPPRWGGEGWGGVGRGAAIERKKNENLNN